MKQGLWPPDDASQTNIDDDDTIRTQYWVDVVSGKNKGRLYGARKLVANYTVGRGTWKHQPFTSNSSNQTIVQLKQQLQARDLAYG